MKKFTSTNEKIFRSIRLLAVKNNSHTDLSTSNAQLSGKGCQYREEDYEIENFVIKRVHCQWKMSR